MSNKAHRFSNKDRSARLKTAQATNYDVIVIGGGITGAGVAMDAALRGLKVLLIEKYDFASGTSSKSTKLIHGGLRYLKQLEFGLVRETGLERAVAHNNIPHLVHPRNMLLPIVDEGTFSSFTASLAISVYDRLAGVKKVDRKRCLSEEEVINSEPLLKKDILKSAILYSEYRTDDARLTVEIIKAAIRNGAEAFNYLEVNDFIYKSNKLSGVICTDNLNGETLNFKAKTIVNAAGPWVDNLRTIDNVDTETNLQLSKGVHIVIAKEKLNIKNAVYFDAFDGRMIFAIPRGKSVYIGTTDTFYHDDPDKLSCTQEDAEYLLEAIQKMFSIPPLSIQDVKSTWTGLRPLIRKKGKGPTELSRRDEIFTSDSGLLTIAGGKLTGFRKMAERVIDLVYKSQSRKTIECTTKNYKIHHNPFTDYEAYEALVQELVNQYPHIKPVDIEYMTSAYGKDVLQIIADSDGSESDLIRKQIAYTIDYEAASLPIDFIERRTGWLYFDIDLVEKYLDDIIQEFATAFSHDQQWAAEQKTICNEIIAVNTLKKIKEGMV